MLANAEQFGASVEAGPVGKKYIKRLFCTEPAGFAGRIVCRSTINDPPFYVKFFSVLEFQCHQRWHLILIRILRDAFKIKKACILGLCPKVVDPLPSPPLFGTKNIRTFWSAFGPPPSFVNLGHFGKKLGLIQHIYNIYLIHF